MPKKMKIPGWPEALTPNMPGFGSIPGLMNPLGQSSLVNNPLTQTLSGGFDFMKNLWGGLPASVPGFVVPTVDIEELDKRIKDLKAVESWLEVNAQLLRATIQALEVQRNTIAAIKSLGGSLTGSAGDFFKAATQGVSAPEPTEQERRANWPMPMPSVPQAAVVPPPAPPVASPVAPSAASVSCETANESLADKAGPARRSGVKPTGSAEPVVQPGLSAGAWLGFLQDQFNKVAMAALSGTEPTAAAPPAAKQAKPATKRVRAAKKVAPKRPRTPPKAK